MKIYRSTVITAVFFFLCLLEVQGETRYFDSLATLSQADKIKACDSIYEHHIAPLDSAHAINTLIQAFKKAEKKHDYTLAVMAQALMGTYYFDKGKISEAVAAYEEGIRICETYDLKLPEAILSHRLGYEYLLRDKPVPAFEYMLRANKLFGSVGYEKTPDIVLYLYQLGYAYYSLAYYDKAIVYLQEALRFPKIKLVYGIWVNNTLALAHQSQNREDSAFNYFSRALDYAVKRDDSVWIGITSGNMAKYYMSRKAYDQAAPLLRLDYHSSMKYKELGSASNALIELAEISMANNQTGLAGSQLDSAKVLMGQIKNYPYLMIWEQSYFRALAGLYYRQQKMVPAYLAMDTLYKVSKKLWQKNDALILTQVEAKIELEKHLAELRLVESERSRLLIRRNAIIVVLVLLIIIVLQTLRRLRLKQKKDNEIYQLEHKRAEEEIRNAGQLLASYTERLQKNSRLIEGFKEELQRLKTQQAGDREEDQETIDKLSSFTILREEDWQEFKIVFSRAHHNFFARLHDKYPDLTQAETRFLALSKLGLSINEMSAALGVSPDSMRKTRLRLRKKISISEHELLHELTQSK